MISTHLLSTIYFADAGIGAGIDSYYEYCLKTYILLGDEDYLYRFNKVKVSLNEKIISCSNAIFVLRLKWQPYDSNCCAALLEAQHMYRMYFQKYFHFHIKVHIC